MSLEFALLGEILRLADDPELRIEDFAEKVEGSPRLAASIVRIANSALYGMEGKIRRLDRATVILGVRAVAEIASSVLVASRMKELRIAELRGEALWLHSLEIAAAAQALARWLGIDGEREAYLVGLLHDLGLAEMYEAHGADYAALVERSIREELPLAGLERERFGEDHADRLRACAADWGFPKLIVDAVGHHHDPGAAPEASHQLATLASAAHALISGEEGGWSDVPGAGADATILEQLGLDAADTEEIRSIVRERVKEIVSTIS